MYREGKGSANSSLTHTPLKILYAYAGVVEKEDAFALRQEEEMRFPWM